MFKRVKLRDTIKKRHGWCIIFIKRKKSMLKIYNSNFQNNDQRFRKALVIGLVGAPIIGALVALLANMLGMMNTFFDLLCAFCMSYVIKEGARSLEKRTVILGGICCFLSMFFYEYFYIFNFNLTFLLIAPFEVIKTFITLWLNVSINGLIGLAMRCIAIYYGAYNSVIL